jgi:hypothetical protein
MIPATPLCQNRRCRLLITPGLAGKNNYLLDC